MSTLVFLIERTAPGWYILLGAGVFWYLRRWSSARYAYKSTYFELEREIARQRVGSAATTAVVFVEFIAIIMGVQFMVAPTVRDDERMTTIDVQPQGAVDGVFATPTRPAPSGEISQEIIDSAGQVDLGGEQAVLVFATPTLTPTPVGTILPNAPEPVGCTNDRAFLQIPANGMQVFQPIRVAGTAYTEDFSLFKLEIGRPGGPFSVLDEEVIPVQELGTLSQFNPAPYPEGEYFFQLMVFDSNAELRESCRVTIYITDPIPTATPIGAG